MSLSELCRMRFHLSIIALAMVSASAVQASPLAPCPPVALELSCDGAVPVLTATRSARADGLTLRIGAAQAGGPLGDALLSVSAAAQAQSMPLASLPDKAQQLVIVGTEGAGGGACCIANVALPAPPPDLCTSAAAPMDQTDTSMPRSDAADVGARVDLVPDCPVGAAAHQCAGTLALTATGAPAGLIPLSLDIEPNTVLETVLSGPLECYGTGGANLFCRIPAQILGQPLTLPLTLSAAPSYAKRTARLCAALALPADERAQITLVQTALTALGYAPGPLDGARGPATRAATAQLARRFDLDTDDPLDPAVLALLGLTPYADANPGNDASCAQTVLPARPRPKPPAEPRVTGPSVQPVEPVEPDIVRDLPRCDPASTVRRGERCACRFANMTRLNAAQCQCRNGLPPVAGAGCP